MTKRHQHKRPPKRVRLVRLPRVNNLYDSDTLAVGLVGTDASGEPVIVTVPFELVQIAVSELNRAASAALQARALIGAPMTMSRRVAVQQPQTFQVGEQGENVLVAFDLECRARKPKCSPPKPRRQVSCPPELAAFTRRI
jgi:hypothetical protein